MSKKIRFYINIALLLLKFFYFKFSNEVNLYLFFDYNITKNRDVSSYIHQSL